MNFLLDLADFFHSQLCLLNSWGTFDRSLAFVNHCFFFLGGKSTIREIFMAVKYFYLHLKRKIIKLKVEINKSISYFIYLFILTLHLKILQEDSTALWKIKRMSQYTNPTSLSWHRLTWQAKPYVHVVVRCGQNSLDIDLRQGRKVVAVHDSFPCSRRCAKGSPPGGLLQSTVLR